MAATRAGADPVAVKANRENAIQLAGQQGSLAIAESMLPKMFSQETYITKPALVDFIREMMVHTSVEGIIGALGGMRDRMDSTHMLPLIKVPTLIIHGANDQLIPVSVAQEMHAAIPGSKITVLPEAGHLVNLEQPSMFTTAIDHFVASTLNLA